MKRALLIASVSVVWMTGCSNEPPKCSDPSTFSVIRQIIVEELGPSHPVASLSAAELENALLIRDPRASGYDEKIKRFSCEATLFVPMKVNDLQFHVGIRYESQLDDNKQHLVVLNGFTKHDWIWISQALITGIVVSKSADHPHSSEPAADAAPATAVAQSYSYEPTVVSLEGQLLASVGQTPDGKKIQFPAIQLSKPITVKGDQETPTEDGVVLMQLVLDEKKMELFEGLKGKSVVVSGTLFHADNGNHYTNVLLTPSVISQK